MSHGLDFSRGHAAIAYQGETPWHGYGTAAKPDWTLEQWTANAGLDYQIVRVPAGALINGQWQTIAGAWHNIRSDTAAVIGNQTFSDRRVEVQPSELIKFIWKYVETDPRFQMQVMGAIYGGAQIWATAAYNPSGHGLTVGGDKHTAHLLARTAFDGSLATVLQTTFTRAVCRNTLSAAYADKRALVSVRHTTAFDPQVAAAQLARLAQSVTSYKAIGDALAQNQMAADDVVALFRHLLGIPPEHTSADVSTRKQNQFNALATAYSTTQDERGGEASAFTALQAVTRYVDHDRSVRGGAGTSEDTKRFLSSQFGSGDAFKGKALAFVMPRVRGKVLVPA